MPSTGRTTHTTLGHIMHINQQAERAAKQAIHDLTEMALAGVVDGIDLSCELEWTGMVNHDGGAQEWYGISAMNADDRVRRTVWVGTGGDALTDEQMRESLAEQYTVVDGPQTSRITTVDKNLMTTFYDVLGSRAWVVAQLQREGWQGVNVNDLCTVLLHPAMGHTLKMVK